MHDAPHIILIAVSIVFGALYFNSRRKQERLLKENRKILSQKKSSETITGQIAEKLAPFLNDFKYDARKSVFLGQPIDYLVFEDEEIVFIEIKSGNSRLSAKQRKIKKLVENKKVTWKEIKIK